MSRYSAVLLNLDGENTSVSEIIHTAAEKSLISFNAISGSYQEILNSVSQWKILPEIVVLRAPVDMNPADVLQELGGRFPEGEAEVIVYGVSNDIELYRILKQMGVREVFAGIPTVEGMTETFKQITQSKIKRTGIDPRKCVYVWSACGGAGGTSVAMSIAKKFANENRRTLYIDLDLATAPGSFMFNADKGARETTGFIDALSNPGRVDALFLERVIDVAGKNLYFLSSRRKKIDAIPLAEAVPSLISRAQESFDMVVVDVPWRCNPELDMSFVQGHSYIVALPTPAGFIGFLTLAKELSNAPGKSPRIGIINKEGEFKLNDIRAESYKIVENVNFLKIPYDPAVAGRMFYEQKTLADYGGKTKKAIDVIFKTLPGFEEETGTISKKKKNGLFFFKR